MTPPALPTTGSTTAPFYGGGLLLLALVLVTVLFRDTALSIIHVWNSSETFAHGYIIVPISAWLIWGKRRELQKQPIKPYWPALLLILLCGAAWFVADLADVQVVRQYAYVAMLPVLVLAITGVAIARVIMFPLLFLLFAVPFGEIFIAPLVAFTAEFTVRAVELTGIPILRDGANFSLPSGSWSVLDACSGVRYLIASVTLGALYAYLMYRSWQRRIIFIVISAVVPIIANGIRAYMIVMIGHLSSMQLAAGVDHVIYGWLFFGLVMLIMYWVGSRWREDIDPAAGTTAAYAMHRPVTHAGLAALASVFCAVLFSAAIWPALAAQLQANSRQRQDLDLSTFHSTWAPAPQFSAWSPDFSPPNTALRKTLASAGRAAQITILYYQNRPRGKGMISSENRLLPNEHAEWLSGPTSIQTLFIADTKIKIRQATLKNQREQLLTWQLNWIGGIYVENNYIAKLLQAKNKLVTGSDDGAVIFLSTPVIDTVDAASAVLRSLLNDHFAELNRVLTNNISRNSSSNIAHGAR